MTAYPEFVLKDLADFSGRPQASYPPFSETALSQALLLFKIGTCLAALPDDENMIELAHNGILDMADHLVLEQPFQKAKASPFNSEGIGSYHYSKTLTRSSAAQAVKKNQETGVMWFDLAVEKMSVCNVVENTPMGGGITIFETPTVFHVGDDHNVHFLSPAEMNRASEWGFSEYNTISSN